MSNKKIKAGKLIRREQAEEIERLKKQVIAANSKTETEFKEHYRILGRWFRRWINSMEEEVTFEMESNPLLHWGQDNFAKDGNGKRMGASRFAPRGYPDGNDGWQRDALLLASIRTNQETTYRFWKNQCRDIIVAYPEELSNYDDEDFDPMPHHFRVMLLDEICSQHCQIWVSADEAKRSKILVRLAKKAQRDNPTLAKQL